MQKAQQLPDTIFSERLRKELFSGTYYEFSAGGTPEDIKELQYKEALAYYARAYHPSNALFYSYGDLDFTKHLEFLDVALL
jgi:Zn-dependent M16 (insulinase) family peptidase